MQNNSFQDKTVATVIKRINTLTPNTNPNWGKMSVSQMLAHCNVTYEMAYEDTHAKPNFFMKFILKTFVKKIVVSDTPYKKNEQTAPQFIIKDEKEFTAEKNRLINYIEKTKTLGAAHFEGKASHSFGKLSASQWDTMFYKHLDHHLTQFGV